MDVVSILRKKRQQVSGLEVEVQGGRVDEHPRVYDRIEIIYRVRGRGVESKAVERAIELSETRYCPAIAMLEKAAEITSRYEIEEVIKGGRSRRLSGLNLSGRVRSRILRGGRLLERERNERCRTSAS
jgi:hypothetical protein